MSQHWTDKEGFINRIDIEGKVSRGAPKETARISDGHNIRFDSPWDATFEHYFDRPDNDFPRIIRLLESMVANHRESISICGAHTCKDSDLDCLWNCILSLAVRSPKFRDGTLAFIHRLRGPINREEHKNLIAMNLKQAYVGMSRDCAGRGKFMVLFTCDKEFIFGDGFYHNISVTSRYGFNARILVPLTPKIAVLYVQPSRCQSESRLVTHKVDDEIVALVNETVQVYSKDCLFYRREKPVLTEHFLKQMHLVYESRDPVLSLIKEIPGV